MKRELFSRHEEKSIHDANQIAAPYEFRPKILIRQESAVVIFMLNPPVDRVSPLRTKLGCRLTLFRAKESHSNCDDIEIASKNLIFTSLVVKLALNW